MIYLLFLLLGASLSALPTAPEVAHGDVTIDQSSLHCQINQHSDKAIINWESFSIGTGEGVSFAQPSNHSVALNRVVGSSPSEIFGKLSSNGQVFLINPQGILFAPSAMVNTAGLVASTLSLLDHQFLEGEFVFRGEGAALVNEGVIHATDGGYIALLGGRVTQEGWLEVNQGAVSLASGSEISLSLNESGTLLATVKKKSLDAYVSNEGVIRAPRGTVILSAVSSSQLLETVVNNSGIIEAHSMMHEQGRVVLRGGGRGIVQTTGKIDVGGSKGGTVSLMGDYVSVQDNAEIIATGDLQAGLVEIGLAGKRRALRTFIGDETLIDVSSTLGNGGEVTIWAQEATFFYGDILADAPAGKGGFVETSSENNFDFTGTVSCVGFDKYHAGHWLLDPPFITIVAKAPFLERSTWMTAKASSLLAKNVIETSRCHLILEASQSIVFTVPVKRSPDFFLSLHSPLTFSDP